MPNVTCAKCGTSWPQAYQFCGRCGGPLHADNFAPVTDAAHIPPPPRGPAPQEPLATASIRLSVLRGAVSEGATVEVPLGVSALGKQAEMSFPNDPLLAARHVVFDRSPETIDIIGIPGEAGVFRRLREPTLVRSGEVIFAGEQYLLVRSAESIPSEPPPPGELPPENFGTPLPPPRLHVTQLLAGGLPGRVTSTDRDQLTIGREGADMSFPQDRFMSGRHLRLEVAPTGHVQVVDSGSLNGTFVRIKRLPQRLHGGDEILCGTLLFRLDVEGTTAELVAAR